MRVSQLKFIALGLVFSFISSKPIFGQISFSHSIGASYYSSTTNISAPGLMYSPRLNVMEVSDELTVSIGTHIGVGISGFNSREGASSIALDIPIVAELNFGKGSNPDADSNFGGFVGLGYGISKIGAQSEFGLGENDAKGIIVNAGILLDIRDMPLGARFSYLINSDKNGPEEYKDVFSLGIFYMIR